LSERLLRAFQQVKLNVVLDLYRMSNPVYRLRLPVPWSHEPQSAGRVLHGLYAHLAAAHLHESGGQPARAACLRCRSWVLEGAGTLLKAHGVLAPAGRRFVTGLAAAAEGVTE
jgi:HEXXH motif-containing protein